MYLGYLAKLVDDLLTAAGQFFRSIWYRVLNDPVWSVSALVLVGLLVIFFYLKFRVTGGK